MRKPRCEIIDPAEVNVVHVCSRTVRQCFLLGDDPVSGENFDHRKGWIEDLLQRFAAQFGIDLIAYAVMSNHFHLILRNRPDVVRTWSDTEVARRWLMICPHRKDAQGRPLQPTETELNAIRNCPERLAEIRRRLADISWWVRLLNQRVAMRANQEQNACGRFFDQRYKAIRLLDEASLVACAAYVDLNPIRAAIAQTIEASDHTSVRCRITSLRERCRSSQSRPVASPAVHNEVKPIRHRGDEFLSPVSLDESTTQPGPQPSRLSTRCSDKGFSGLSTPEYLKLLDWTARQSRPDKPGCTPEDVPPVIQRLGFSATAWMELVSSFGELFHDVAGHPSAIDSLRSHRTHRRFHVRRRLRELLSEEPSAAEPSAA